MTRHWRMLLVSGSSECDVDKGRLVTTRNVLERANIILEGYFRALYLPLGGSRTCMENALLTSMKLCISMFNGKPPCMPLCFGTVEIILLEAVGAFSSFLASTAATVSLLASAATGFCSFLAFAVVAFSYFLASMTGSFSSVFSSYLVFFFLLFFFNFFFFLRLSFQPGWVM